MRGNWRGSWGVVQIPLIVGMVIMAVALPVALKLGSQSQDTRNRAAESQCSSGETQCSGNTVQTCSGGKWVNGQYCSSGCSGGACKNACAPNSSCGSSTCKGQTCKDSCGNTWQGQKDCSTPTNPPVPTTPPRDCDTAATQDCNWNGKPGYQRCNAEGKWGACQAKNPCSGECLAYASSCGSVGRGSAGGDCASGVCCGGALPTNTPIPTLTPTPTVTPMCTVGEKECVGGVLRTCYSPAPGTLVWNTSICETGCKTGESECNPTPTSTPTPTLNPTPKAVCVMGEKKCEVGIEYTCYEPYPGGFVWNSIKCESGECLGDICKPEPTPTPTKPVQTPTPMCTVGEKECVGGVLRTCYSPAPGTLVWNTSICETGCKTGANECNPKLTPTISGRPAPKGSYRRPKGL
ncbi:MAG: hypothetical protein WCT01_05030 [Candidatus Shapirobacteria bacterium]